MNRMKRVNVPISEVKSIIEEPLHTVVQLGKDWVNKVYIGEPTQITTGDDPEDRGHVCIAEIVSVKLCRISEIEKTDYRRQKSGYKTPKDVVSTLQMVHPKEIVNLGSVVTLITLRRCDYDLKSLGKYFKKA